MEGGGGYVVIVLVVWGVDCHWVNSLRGLSELYPKNINASISYVFFHSIL
jgi:hypothetical protein